MLPLIPYSVFSHTPTLIALTQVIPGYSLPSLVLPCSLIPACSHITCVLRECLFPLPWCRTTTKSSHSHFHGVVLPPSLPTHCSERTCAPTHTSMVSYYHQVITHPHQSLCSHSLPSTMSSHTLLPSHFISPHSLYKCITNHLPHSPTHHASITSSSPHHLFLSPITTNRFLSLHTTLLTPPFHSQPSQSSPKSSPISIHTHNENSRTL